MKQGSLLVPSAFLPETNGNRVFAISSTPLDFEIEVREFKGVDMTQEKKKKKKKEKSRIIYFSCDSMS